MPDNHPFCASPLGSYTLPVRIAIVSREVSPFFGAGIGSYVAAMCRAWAGAGHEVHLVSASHAGFLERGPATLNARCHAVTQELTPDFEDHPYPFMRHAAGVYRLLLTLHGQHPFDYIEFPDYWAEGYFAIQGRCTLRRFAGAVLGIRLHTPTRECRILNDEAWLDDEIATLEHCEEEAIRGGDVLISPSRSLLEILTRRLDLKKQSFVVPYPFEAPSPAPGSATHRPTILYFGRLERRKGVHLLIAAAQRLFEQGLDFDVRLIGGDTQTGPSGTSMRAHLGSLIQPPFKDRIRLDGPVPRQDLMPIIRSIADGGGACCFPSLWENYPNTCLEAMALGCPVIGSDAGGMAEIIADGLSGVVFRAGDIDHLADCLRRVITEHPFRGSLAAAAPGRIASITDPGAIVEQTIAAIRAIAPHPRTTSPRPVSPAASVIIPFYNLSEYLPATLESLRAQTFRDFETIIVNDGSTESGAAVLLKRVESGEFGPARVINRANGGLSNARNTGLAAARGRWVLPLDADDLLEPVFLEAATTAAALNPDASLVTSLVTYFDDESSSRGVWAPLGFDRDLLATTNCASTCTALIDRETLERLGGYDTSLASYEDWDLYCRMALQGLSAAIIPEPLIRYRLRADSMMRTVGLAKRQHFQSHLLARYPSLPLSPDRTMRIIVSRGGSEAAEARAREIIDDNIRYRVADKVNIVLKRSGVQKAIKGVAARILGSRGSSTQK